jgi:hypothetical protein
MKRTALAATMLAAALGTAAADEMPITGTCTSGTDTISFNGSKMPVDDPMTGDFGLVQIWMSTQDYAKLAPDIPPPPLFPEESEVFIDENGETAERSGFRPLGFGELSAEVLPDNGQGMASIRMSTGNFKIVFEGGPDRAAYGIYGRSWYCTVKPNL